jgi:hypothetical protein
MNSPGFSMNPRPEQKQEMDVLPLQKLEVAHSYLQLDIAHAITRTIRDLLKKDETLRSIVSVKEHLNGLIGHIARRALLENGRDFAAIEYDHEHPDALKAGIVSVVEAAQQKAAAVFERWKQRSDYYIPSVITQKTVAPEVWNYASLIEEDFPTETLGLYHAVRTAAYETMIPESLEGVEPGYHKRMRMPHTIEESYGVPLLQPDHLELLFDPQDGKKRFRQRTRRGVMVFPFRERQKNAIGTMDLPSVYESMWEGLKHPPCNPRLGRYQGRILRSGDSILAWDTYLQTPRNPNSSHKSELRKYMSRGVTNEKMLYHGTPGFKEYEQVIEYIQLFDTVISHHRYAVDRLLALSFREMLRENPELKNIIPFRLKELHVMPAIPGMRGGEPIRFADNISSAHLFEKRHFRETATDFNEYGPSSPRRVRLPRRDQQQEHDQEIDLRLIPEWVVMSAPMDEANDASTKEWRHIQLIHGDISHDHGERWWPR